MFAKYVPARFTDASYLFQQGMSFALQSSNTVRPFENNVGKVTARPAVVTKNDGGHLLVSKLPLVKRSATHHNESNQVSLIPEVYIVVVVSIKNFHLILHNFIARHFNFAK